MEESTTYQTIIRKDRLAEARRLLLLIGEEHLGFPDESARAAVNALDDVDRVEQLCRRILQVESWGALLATRSRRRPNRHRGGST